MSNQQTIRQILALDTRITQIETLLQSTNPNVSLSAATNPMDLSALSDLTALKDDVEQLKNASSVPMDLTDLTALKDEIEQLKNTSVSTELTVLKDEIEQLKNTSASMDLTVLRDEIENLKRATKDITEIDAMIKTNFEETNRKFDEVNRAVTSLDANMEKANRIEADVEELKRKVQ
jgi:hypothetical protein